MTNVNSNDDWKRKQNSRFDFTRRSWRTNKRCEINQLSIETRFRRVCWRSTKKTNQLKKRSCHRLVVFFAIIFRIIKAYNLWVWELFPWDGWSILMIDDALLRWLMTSILKETEQEEEFSFLSSDVKKKKEKISVIWRH